MESERQGIKGEKVPAKHYDLKIKYICPRCVKW